MNKLLLCILTTLFGLVNLNAQNSISGRVLSEKDQKTIGFASAYIDGTSKVAMTDSNGYFIIKNIDFPCRLVLSCVGYELKSIALLSASEECLNITLKEQAEQLAEISVAGKSRRKQNLELFKKAFLGDDKWAQNTKLEQDNGLVFEHISDTLHKGATNKTLEVVRLFKVKTKSSLKVRLPLLGYDASVDIVSFSLTSNCNNKTTGYDMYTRFSTYNPPTERERKKIESNRREIYYNSSIYFFRALFADKLKENGFVASLEKGYSVQTPTGIIEFDITPYIVKKSEDKIALIGLKGKKIGLACFCNNKNMPINLENYKTTYCKPVLPWGYSWNERNSYITILSDTCIIYKNGTVADNNIVFSGDMATYVGGRLLPLDYQPQPQPMSVSEKLYDASKANSIGLKPSAELKKVNSSPELKIKKITSQIQLFTNEYPQEKVYLHFDNTSYYQGENIWFKAYVVTAERNNISPLSKVLYVDLVSPEGNIVETKKYKIENGQCNGDFKLPTLAFAGFYEVRAYTRYMLNFGDQNYFSRVFPVYDQPLFAGNYKKKITERPFSQRIPQLRPSVYSKERLNITFYPEGGNLIKGINSKVAFKALIKEGENVPISGMVMDAQGKMVVEFESGHMGMGVFNFTPKEDRYFAKVRYQGKEYSFELPSALPQGYAMTVDNNDAENMELFVQKSATIPGELLGLTITCRGKVYASDQLDMSKDSIVQLMIPKKMLPSGVIQLTLFNVTGEVLSERLAFVNHFTQMKIAVSQDKPIYNPFEHVNIDFQLNDHKGNPIEANFSVAVRDAATDSSNPYSDNMLTNLLFSSELKGYIENPCYYFESDNVARHQALDLLMLTQGWSRYVWKQMAGITPFEAKQPIEDGLYIQGSIQSLFSKKKLENIGISMTLLADSTSQRGKYLTDKDGKFVFGLQDFKGQAKLLLQTKENDKKKEKNILLDRNFSPNSRSYFYPELHLQDYVRMVRDTVTTNQDSMTNSYENNPQKKENNKQLSMDKNDHLLKEVTINAKNNNTPIVKFNVEYKVEKEMDKIRDTGDWEPAGIAQLLGKLNNYFLWQDADIARYKGNKSVLFIRDNSSAISSDLSSILTEGLSDESRTNEVGTAVQSNDSHSEDMFQQKNTIPDLEEIESVAIIEDENDILRLCPQLIASKQVDPSKIVVVLIHCKKKYHHEPYGMRETKFSGYAYTKEFFQPNYEKVLLTGEKDYRRTLYWNPNVKTDVNGKATISFFNNSSCKSMLINAEAVTANGVIGVISK